MNMLHAEIVPTILAHDDDEYHTKLTLVENLVTRVQIDIMDGEFVKNTTIGAPTIEGYASELWRDIHLMVAEPLAHLGEYSRLGVDHLIFHVEAVRDVSEIRATAAQIKTLGNRVGLAFNLETPLSLLEGVAAEIDLVQLMAVGAGFGAQNFQSEALARTLSVRERYPEMPIAVDGGVTLENIGEVQAAGATMLVVGSHLFNSQNVGKYLESLRFQIAIDG